MGVLSLYGAFMGLRRTRRARSGGFWRGQSTTKALCWARTWEGEPVGDGKSYPVYDKLMAAWQVLLSSA
jgi:hypothetical protein